MTASTGNEWWRRRPSPKPTAVHPWRAVALEELSARAAAAWITAETGLLAWATVLRAAQGAVWAVVLLPHGDAGEPVFLRTLGDCAPWFSGARAVNQRPAPRAPSDEAEAQVRAVLDAVTPSPPLTAETLPHEAGAPTTPCAERNADDREPAAAPAE